MNTQALAQVARDIATRAHAGQVDKSGVEYIAHPERVAAGVRAHGGDDAAVATAWLHDVLEDCEVTEADLGAAGIPVPVIEAVRAVTKVAGETLEDYCTRVRGNPTGLLVKRADIEDNTDPARTALLPEQLRVRLATKYARTRSLLGFPQPH
ncbi:HD domain-containing protein [Paeniglutamicibacter gangotriensis]|uniref:HD domain-containing protein n=1 Tax=Paeniglutamicibacter gangotriensis TaxID=254787 RepID=A0A5B0EKF6_9MICC|nr:HD domain-containing protein [Paeniglutamicibacter gangotriensis]KAA0978645.1 HD domain-containing protein [Paeniglutamicibacter gangotriensis]